MVLSRLSRGLVLTFYGSPKSNSKKDDLIRALIKYVGTKKIENHFSIRGGYCPSGQAGFLI